MYQQQHVKSADIYISQLHDQFLEYSGQNVGEGISKFKTHVLPSKKGFGTFLLNERYDQHLHTGLIQFMLPHEAVQPPTAMTQVDVLQHYIDGVSALMVAKAFGTNPDLFKNNIKKYLATATYMNIHLKNNCFHTPERFPTSSSPTTTMASHPIYEYFRRQMEDLKVLYEFLYAPKSKEHWQPAVFHLHASRIFFLIHSGIWQLPFTEPEKLSYSQTVYDHLKYSVNAEPGNTKFRYSLGTFCYSYFKLHQRVYNINSLMFFNHHRENLIETKLYSKMYSYLKESNQLYQIEFDKEAARHPEEKAQSWIQLYINDAQDRISLAKLVASDPDVVPYHSKVWYKEIMQSIDSEEEQIARQLIQNEQDRQTEMIKLEKEQADHAKHIQQQLQLQQLQQQQHQLELQHQQPQQQTPVPIVNGNENVGHVVALPLPIPLPAPTAATVAILPQQQQQPPQLEQSTLYYELKQSLIMDGLAPKYMNNDSFLFNTVILASLQNDRQASKEAEIAKKRLSERIDLYMANGATISQFVNGNWDDYCNEMSKNGIWGDHLTLVAAAEIYKAKISIISSVESNSNFVIEIVPTKIENPKVLLLSHYSEFHYGSLCFKMG
eukprot:gene13306-15641_t